MVTSSSEPTQRTSGTRELHLALIRLRGNPWASAETLSKNNTLNYTYNADGLLFWEVAACGVLPVLTPIIRNNCFQFSVKNFMKTKM